MAESNIKALFIFEILGKPPEHIKNALGEFIDKLGEQKGIEILRKEVHEPKPVEKEGMEGMFSSFAEVELIADNLSLIFDITLNMLPSHVEILAPRELTFKNFDLSSVVSNLAVKIHRYDEIAKAVIMERNTLIKRNEELQGKINELVEGKMVSVKKPVEKKVKKKSGKKKTSKKKEK